MITEKDDITALEYSKQIRDGIKEKATKNKNQSTFLFLVVLITTVFAPILILLPFGDVVTKYIPAFLTASAALATYWLQLRKPQERWVIYRGAQREIEYEIDRYKFETGIYSDSQNKEKLLAERVSKRALELHYEWVPFAPKVEEIEKILQGDNTIENS